MNQMYCPGSTDPRARSTHPMADGLRTKLGTAIRSEPTDEYRSDIEEVVHFTDNSISDDAIFLRILHAPALQPR